MTILFTYRLLEAGSATPRQAKGVINGVKKNPTALCFHKKSLNLSY